MGVAMYGPRLTYDRAVSPADSIGRARPEAVYYYGTCLMDLFFPEAGLSGIRLLEREGLWVVFPQGQTCCGTQQAAGFLIPAHTAYHVVHRRD